MALHPLYLTGDLETYYSVPWTVQWNDGPNGTQTIVKAMPPEREFESLAARVRPFTLENDWVAWTLVLNALRRLTATRDKLTRRAVDHFEREWAEATRRDSLTRAYSLVTDGGHVTDLELAYGWLYGDLVHGDDADARMGDLHDRYEAAVGVFSHIALVAVEMLHFVNHLVEFHELKLPLGAFTDQVIVSKAEFVMRVEGYVAQVGPGTPPALPEIIDGKASVPVGFEPLHEHSGFLEAIRRRAAGGETTPEPVLPKAAPWWACPLLPPSDLGWPGLQRLLAL